MDHYIGVLVVSSIYNQMGQYTDFHYVALSAGTIIWGCMWVMDTDRCHFRGVTHYNGVMVQDMT